MTHVDSGMRCLVAHFKDGKIQDACISCQRCCQWIRPEDMGNECTKPYPESGGKR